jgi:iron only hydrogenase large subunit-like protein
MTFDELYDELVAASAAGREPQSINWDNTDRYDPEHLDCLLNPKKHPVIWRLGKCPCPPADQQKCAENCEFEAITHGQNGSVQIGDQCVGCSKCVDECKYKKLTASRDIIPALNAIKSSENLVYALVAPAFLGQFGSSVTPGKLRSALKLAGFDGVIEVALFADILTLKEALEFDRNILTEKDFQLTSCCCPMWIAMIRKVYNDLMPHVPAAVSPMIASGRAVKTLHPGAVTIFIGPCMAKKAEAREKDIADAVDYVLTFKEVEDIFSAMDIDPVKMEENIKDHSSKSGRIYAHTGGVSEAVRTTVEKLDPGRKITVRTRQADGVAACKAMMNDLVAGSADANFFEGMGCVGGCVGGPRAILDKEEGWKNVEEYAKDAAYETPLDNYYVIELLKRLGLDTIESLLLDNEIFTRKF